MAHSRNEKRSAKESMSTSRGQWNFKSLDLRSKRQPISDQDIVEGLIPNGPRKKQAPFVFIPQCKSKHSVKTVHAYQHPIARSVNDDLSIGLRFKYMPGRFQLPAQLDKIINLAVKNHLHITVFVANGL